MSEEIKKKVTELTDEEMDKVAGGKTAIVRKSDNATYMCDLNVSYQEFMGHLYDKTACSNYILDPTYIFCPTSYSNRNSCDSCQHLHFGTNDGSGIVKLKSDGWEVFDVFGNRL